MKPPPEPLAVLLNPRVQTVWAAREVGARTLMVGPDLAAPGMNRVLADIDQALEVDWRSYRDLTGALSHLTGQAQVSVFGFDQPTALTAARVNWSLRLPGSSPLAVETLSDTLTLRQRVGELNGSHMRFVTCTPAELASAACQVGFPCTVRPHDRGAEWTLPVMHDVIEAEQLAARIPRLDPAGGTVRPEETALVVEEYLDGPRVQVEAHSYHGSHTVLSSTPAIPGGLAEETLPEVQRLVSDTLDAADYLVGPSQTTLALTSRGPRLVDAQAFPALDSDLPGYAIAALLELTPPTPCAQAS